MGIRRGASFGIGSQVRDLWLRASVSHTVGRRWSKCSAWTRAWVLRTVNLISLFVDEGMPASATVVRRVSVRDLGPLTRARQSRKGGVHFSPGDVVRSGQRLVAVVRVLREVQASSVARALDMHSWFSMGGPVGRVVWGAVRVHHRCRLLIPPDACCESVGSLIRQLWDPQRGLSPGQLADSVFLSQASVFCVGGQRDEALVTAVVQALRATSRYNFREVPAQELPHHIAELLERQRASGRGEAADSLGLPAELGDVTTAKARRAALLQRSRLSAPSDLPATMMEVVDSCRDVAGRVKSLPMDVIHLHSRQRGATVSVEVQRKKQWLESEAGKKWKDERSRLLQADDHDEENDKAKRRRAVG